jgi:hypothetical protein
MSAVPMMDKHRIDRWSLQYFLSFPDFGATVLSDDASNFKIVCSYSSKDYPLQYRTVVSILCRPFRDEQRWKVLLVENKRSSKSVTTRHRQTVPLQ